MHFLSFLSVKEDLRQARRGEGDVLLFYLDGCGLQQLKAFGRVVFLFG